MKTKTQKLLDEIEYFKRTKPEGWKGAARQCLNELAKLDDPYREHVWTGNEQSGRHALTPNSCPRYDRMHDRSYP